MSVALSVARDWSRLDVVLQEPIAPRGRGRLVHIRSLSLGMLALHRLRPPYVITDLLVRDAAGQVTDLASTGRGGLGPTTFSMHLELVAWLDWRADRTAIRILESDSASPFIDPSKLADSDEHGGGT